MIYYEIDKQNCAKCDTIAFISAKDIRHRKEKKKKKCSRLLLSGVDYVFALYFACMLSETWMVKSL